MFPHCRPLLLAVFFLGMLLSVRAQSPCTGPGIFSSTACAGDEVSTDEKELFDAVNAFRTANGKSSLQLSRTLSIVGNRRMLDLTQNMRSLTHSWSNCPYDLSNEKTWSCMIDAPARLKSGYSGTGYETLYATGSKKVDPNAAVAAWKKSALHTSIILGTGMFADMHWDEFGVAISGGYATLWFGQPGDSSKSSARGTALDSIKVLGAVEDVRAATAVWKGRAANGRLRIEIGDRAAAIEKTSTRFFAASNPAETIGSREMDFIADFLRSAFPDWKDSGEWLSRSVRGAVFGRESVKLTGHCSIEVGPASNGEIRVAVLPDSKAKARESF